MEALLVVDEEEKAEAIDKRERHDELDEEVAAELAVLVDMKDEAVEVRRESMACENMRWIRWGGCFASRASICRIDSSGMSRLSSMVGGVAGWSRQSRAERRAWGWELWRHAH